MEGRQVEGGESGTIERQKRKKITKEKKVCRTESN